MMELITELLQTLSFFFGRPHGSGFLLRDSGAIWNVTNHEKPDVAQCCFQLLQKREPRCFSIRGEAGGEIWSRGAPFAFVVLLSSRIEEGREPQSVKFFWNPIDNHVSRKLELTIFGNTEEVQESEVVTQTCATSAVGFHNVLKCVQQMLILGARSIQPYQVVHDGIEWGCLGRWIGEVMHVSENFNCAYFYA